LRMDEQVYLRPSHPRTPLMISRRVAAVRKGSPPLALHLFVMDVLQSARRYIPVRSPLLPSQTVDAVASAPLLVSPYRSTAEELSNPGARPHPAHPLVTATRKLRRISPKRLCGDRAELLEQIKVTRRGRAGAARFFHIGRTTFPTSKRTTITVSTARLLRHCTSTTDRAEMRFKVSGSGDFGVAAKKASKVGPGHSFRGPVRHANGG
jgi:hypothetical protein